MKILFEIVFSYTGNSVKITLMPGVYIFECWGAQGYTPSTEITGGKGAYTKGVISLKERRDFYVFVGQYGKYYSPSPAYNGGGIGQTTGGGASDIRLVNGTWDNFNSLKSRIMVAAGGGGPDSGEKGGSGGGLKGIDAVHGKGGTQTAGGFGFVNGSFGKGGGYEKTDGNGCGGGGGGYYGGGSSTVSGDYAGGGGSSFISGYPECNAISEESTENNIIHTNSPIHYSGLVFKSPEMISGDSLMPSPTNCAKETGHESDGYIRITLINIKLVCTQNKRIRSNFLLMQIVALYLS